jgi:predicted aspartyl protease
MIRYNYTRQVSPPAPFVYLTLSCVQTGRELWQQPAQIDTGADRTVIPKTLVEELGLVPLDEVPVSGFSGEVLLLQTYCLQVQIHNFAPKQTEVIAHASQPFILLGRDLLNQFRIVLDGPQLFLEIAAQES